MVETARLSLVPCQQTVTASPAILAVGNTCHSCSELNLRTTSPPGFVLHRDQPTHAHLPDVASTLRPLSQLYSFLPLAHPPVYS